MGIQTNSAFYYGYEVNGDNNLLAIDEGSGRVDVVLVSGRYTLTTYLDMVNTSLNDVLTNIYQVTLDRNTRIVTIDVSASVELLISDIASSATGFTLLGFTGSNVIGTNLISDSTSGKEYLPQFKLQDYVDFNYNKEYIDGSVKESANGDVEIVSFGLKEYTEFKIDMITDIEMRDGAPIESNVNGLGDAIDFMDWCISKSKLEFMKDRDDRVSFYNVLLESTTKSKDGIAYKLNEKRQVQGIYDTGKLRFRKL